MNDSPKTRSSLDWRIAKYFSWNNVLAILNANVATNFIPSKASCPICRKLESLLILPDKETGAWGYCYACNFSGDMIQLASAVWNNLAINATVYKLHEAGLTLPASVLTGARINKYVNSYLTYRQKLDDWSTAVSARSYLSNKHHTKIHDKLSLKSHIDKQRWQKQLAHFVGWSHADEIVALFNENTELDADRYSILVSQIFSGNRWYEFFCIKHYDLPGRLCGLTCFGRIYKAEMVWQYVSLTKARYRTRSNKPSVVEAGLGFYESAKSVSELFANTVFVVQDPMIALKLHSRWFINNSKPLPVVLAYVGQDYFISTKNVFDSLPDKDWVFWADKPSPELFQQASKCNGRIFIQGLTDPEFTELNIWLFRLQKRAKNWKVVLNKYLARLSDAEVETMLCYFKLNNISWHKLTGSLSKANKAKVEYLSTKQYPQKFTHICIYGTSKRCTLSERDNCWYIDDMLISDAVLVISKVYITESNEIRASGHICYKDNTYPLDTSHSDLTSNPAKVIEETLIMSKAGVPTINPTWGPHLYTVSKYLYPIDIQS